MLQNLKNIEIDNDVHLLSGLTFYSSIKDHELLRAWQKLLECLNDTEPDVKKIYNNYFLFGKIAIKKNWTKSLINFILEDDNYFTRLAASEKLDNIQSSIKIIAARDLAILQKIHSIHPGEIKKYIKELFKNQLVNNSLNTSDHALLSPETWPDWNIPHDSETSSNLDSEAAAWLHTMRSTISENFSVSKSWDDLVDMLANFYNAAGYGIFNQFPAFRWSTPQKSIHGISNIDSIRLTNLIGQEREQAIVLENTDHFLANLPSSNILLYGSRGTGKSSLIKALMHRYVSKGLRLVEIAKTDFKDFPELIKLLGQQPQKFIIYIDDLSFEDSEIEYKSLKSILEGGLETKPANVLIYATSNRRHLVKENFSDRTGDEINIRDSIEEKLSLADRFGITVTFSSPDQEQFLNIVEKLASDRNIEMPPQELQSLALRWQMWHNGRSGRSARQFIDYLSAQKSYQSFKQ